MKLSPERSGIRLRPLPAISLSKNKTVIRILNPLPGGSPYTNPRRAHYFIATGRAEFAGPYQIRFLPQVQQVKQLAIEMRIRYIAMGLNPDDISAGGLATRKQIKGVPVIAPLKLIREGSERFRVRSVRCGPVRVLSAL